VLEFVSATRLTRDAFWERAALALSLKRMESDERWVPRVAFENTRGLPEVFNERIRAQSEHDILAFVHDDIWLDDFFTVDHVAEALDEFHVVGVAGNRRRVPGQPTWAHTHITDQFVWDEAGNLSGGVAHGSQAWGVVNRFGETPAECELLDGLFIAARRSTLLEHEVLFDPLFRFHFYDLDFCRSARKRGLKVGTWPIAVTHQSMGGFGSESWRDGYAKYFGKWKD
jgi:GT2 family glycosyltransferase